MLQKAIQKQNLNSFHNIIACSNPFSSNFMPLFKLPKEDNIQIEPLSTKSARFNLSKQQNLAN
jgi:hypothetical protein